MPALNRALTLAEIHGGSLRIGDRRDAKQESSFYDGSSSLRRPLRQALIADRKR